MPVSYSGTAITWPDNSTTTSGWTGFKNRIINPGMVIDQRNAGASVTQTTSGLYTLDRWKTYGTAASKFSVQQNAGSVTPPAGFTNYLGCTSLSAYSVGSSDEFILYQLIEGFNAADLDFGKSTAKTVTLSFWVRSSLTGTFGGALRNASAARSYPYSYTIFSANTWEQKSITIAGDTSGTWLTTNGVGIEVTFGLGQGASTSGTAGAWASSSATNATGATSVVGTNGATFYITGVQLERGSTASSFEYRDYGTEFLRCQRYYQATGNISVSAYSSTGVLGYVFPCQMRASPTITFSYGGTNNAIYRIDTGATQTLTSPVIINTATALQNMYAFTPSSWASAAGTGFFTSWALSAEL